MIVDQLLRLASAQQLGGALSGSLTALTNVVDLSQVRNLGQGQVLYAQFYVNSEFLSSTSTTTVQFQIRLGSNSALSNDPKIVGVSDTYTCGTTSATTALPTGARIIVPIGANIDWLRVANATANQTGGQVYLGGAVYVSGQTLAANPKCQLTVDLCLDHQDAYGWNPAPGTANNPVWGSVYPKNFTII